MPPVPNPAPQAGATPTRQIEPELGQAAQELVKLAHIALKAATALHSELERINESSEGDLDDTVDDLEECVAVLQDTRDVIVEGGQQSSNRQALASAQRYADSGPRPVRRPVPPRNAEIRY